MRLAIAASAFMLTSLSVIAAPAQNRQSDDIQRCHGPIYTAKEVTRRARITKGPDFSVIYKAFGGDVHARVNLEAVLCRSGRITDIRIVESVPPKLAEFVVAAVSLMRFTPAEMNWHTVSQKQKFEFSINDDSDVKKIDPTAAAGRLLERLEIVGNRRISAEQIRSWMKTRVGEPYDSDQIQRDLKAILATGIFNNNTTRVYTEEGARGGVGVIFELQELPVINEVKFDGLKVDVSVVLNALEGKQFHLRMGTPYRMEQMKEALRVIKQALEASGQRVAKVDLKTELVNAMTINLTFVITND